MNKFQEISPVDCRVPIPDCRSLEVAAAPHPVKHTRQIAPGVESPDTGSGRATIVQNVRLLRGPANLRNSGPQSLQGFEVKIPSTAGTSTVGMVLSVSASWSKATIMINLGDLLSDGPASSLDRG